MSGYEVAQRLRANPVTRDALLIALTGLGAADGPSRARLAGRFRRLSTQARRHR
ncbi:MAG: hypothetical protein WDN30_14645 [Pararobbsia sp.]